MKYWWCVAIIDLYLCIILVYRVEYLWCVVSYPNGVSGDALCLCLSYTVWKLETVWWLTIGDDNEDTSGKISQSCRGHKQRVPVGRHKQNQHLKMCLDLNPRDISLYSKTKKINMKDFFSISLWCSFFCRKFLARSWISFSMLLKTFWVNVMSFLWVREHSGAEWFYVRVFWTLDLHNSANCPCSVGPTGDLCDTVDLALKHPRAVKLVEIEVGDCSAGILGDGKL